jgi:NADP-dependent 3-hydroxy acid dehydrogenase YdfG
MGSEKFSVVTGGSKGIGAAVARYRLDKGDYVTVVASSNSLNAFMQTIPPKQRMRLLVVQANLGTLDGVHAVARELAPIPKNQLTLYSNAGVYLSDEDVAQLRATNAGALEQKTYLNGRAGRDLLGIIMPARAVITGSTAAHWHYPGGTWYNATKLAAELDAVRTGGLGIDTRIVSPGNTATGIQDAFGNNPADVMRDTDVAAVIGNMHSTPYFSALLVPVLGANTQDNADVATRMRMARITMDEFRDFSAQPNPDAHYITLTQQRYRPLQQ